MASGVNLVGVLGLSSIVAPDGLLVLVTMVGFAAAVACLPIWARGRVIPRAAAARLFAGFVAYTVQLVFDATHLEVPEVYATAMLHIVLPLVTVVLGLEPAGGSHLPPPERARIHRACTGS